MWTSLELISHKNSRLIRYINLVSSKTYSKDYYQVLDLKRNSTRREIKHAYYRLSKKFHPDVNAESNAEEKFKAIQEAYQILGDDRRRSEYDLSLNEGYHPGQATGETSYSTRAYKKRTGPVYTGSTSAYNFDEYYKSHYGPTIKKPPPHMSGFARHHSSKHMNDEELKQYWNRKEFNSEDNYLTKRLSEFFYRSIFIGVSLILIYYVLKKIEASEVEAGKKTYIHNMQQNGVKK